MSQLILVCGPTGVGKTTYSLKLANETPAIRFSIDPWMNTLFAKDMTQLDYDWMIERVNRCYEQIWDVSKQILALDGNVVLDLGFTERSQRANFFKRAESIGIEAELHYLHASKETRRTRVDKRNSEKDPAVYTFDVTEFMFDFMESRFEVPDRDELDMGRSIENG